MGLLQTKKTNTATEMSNKMRKQPMKQETIFANHILHAGLPSKISKELNTIQYKKMTIQLGVEQNHRYSTDLNRHFSKWVST